jgi:hypothetical protein
MAVWIAEQYSHQCVCRPRLHQRAFPESQGKDTRESPDWLQHGDKGTLPNSLTEPRYPKQCEYPENGIWDREKIGRELCSS